MFNRHRVLVLEDNEVLEMNDGDGYTTMGMHLMPLDYILKMVKMVNWLFYYNKKKYSKPTNSPKINIIIILNGAHLLEISSELIDERICCLRLTLKTI